MRRRLRRTFPWRAFLWLAVAANVVVAGYASRLTAVRHIEVVGARPGDQDRIQSILSALRGVPDARVDRARVETEVLREPSVRDATLTTNLFGQGRLTVEYRRPVAYLVGMHHLAIDGAGVVYSEPVFPPNLTPIVLPDGAPPTLLGLAGNWQAGRLARLAVDARTFAPPGGVSIVVDREGAISLNLGAGRVMLGSSDELDRKLAVLRKRIEARPEELAEIEELVLSNPDRPAIVKKKQVIRS